MIEPKEIAEQNPSSKGVVNLSSHYYYTQTLKLPKLSNIAVKQDLIYLIQVASGLL